MFLGPQWMPPLGATLSSTVHPDYPASACIDSDANTICASDLNPSPPWISVRVNDDTGHRYGILRVDVYNRNDAAIYQEFLSPFDVYVGDSPGATTFKCGDTNHVATGAGPFHISCHAHLGDYATVRLAGDTTGRYLCASPPTNNLHASCALPHASYALTSSVRPLHSGR